MHLRCTYMYRDVDVWLVVGLTTNHSRLDWLIIRLPPREEPAALFIDLFQGRHGVQQAILA